MITPQPSSESLRLASLRNPREATARKTKKHWDEIKMYIFTGPSGSGKSTTIKKIFESDIAQYCTRIVSTTTRPRAENEVDGVDYHFVTHKQFGQLIRNRKMFEFKMYGSHYYGMQIIHVQEALASGKLVINDVEVKGAIELMKAPHVFCQYMHVDHAILEKRLRKRKREGEKEIQERLWRCKYDAALHLNFDEEFDNTKSSPNQTFFYFYSRMKEMEIVKKQMPKIAHPVLGRY